MKRQSLEALAPIVIAALLATGAFFAIGARGLEWAQLSILAFAAAAFVVAAFLDMRTGRIDNYISLSLVVVCLAFTLVSDRTLVGFAVGLVSGFLFVVIAVVVQLTGGGWIKLAGALVVWAVPYNWQIAAFLLPISIVINFAAFRFIRSDLKAIPLGPAVGTVGLVLTLILIRPILGTLG